VCNVCSVFCVSSVCSVFCVSSVCSVCVLERAAGPGSECRVQFSDRFGSHGHYGFC